MTTRRLRLLTSLCACLALVGLVFQVAALDHWTPGAFEDVRGIEHTDSHATHCHGAAAGCAESGGAAYWATAAPAAIPVPPMPHREPAGAIGLAPAEVPLTELFHPPRAA